MLFNGAKKGTTTETNNNLQDSKVRKDKKKQLFIGKDGNLLHSGCLVTMLHNLKSFCKTLYYLMCFIQY